METPEEKEPRKKQTRKNGNKAHTKKTVVKHGDSHTTECEREVLSE